MSSQNIKVTLTDLPHTFITNAVLNQGQQTTIPKPVTTDTEAPKFTIKQTQRLLTELPKGSDLSLFRNIASNKTTIPKQTSSTTRIGRVLYTNHFKPEDNAEALFRYTMQHEPNLPSLYHLIDEAQSLGNTNSLSCVFHSQAMNEIIDNKDQYQTVDDVFAAIYARQSQLIACLGFGQKLQYGPRIKRLLQDFQNRSELLNGLSELYGNLRNVSPGVGMTDLLSYFFRPDKLDQQAIQIFDAYIDKLKTHLGRTNVEKTRKRFFFFDRISF